MGQTWDEYVEGRMACGNVIIVGGIILFGGAWLIHTIGQYWRGILLAILGIAAFVALIFLISYLVKRHTKYADVNALLKTYREQCQQLGANHVETLDTLNQLAVAYNRVENYHKAIHYGTIVYREQCQVLGPTHPKTVLSLTNLALYYKKRKAYEKAQELYETAYDALCETVGRNHDDALEVLKNLNNIAIQYDEMKNADRCIQLLQKIFDIRFSVLGATHPDTRLSLYNLAITHKNIGNLDEAAELLEKLYKVQCGELGEKHQDTLSTLKSLKGVGVLYTEKKMYAQASNVLTTVYNYYKKTFGTYHADTLGVMNLLGDVEYLLGHYEQALTWYENVYSLRYTPGFSNEQAQHTASQITKIKKVLTAHKAE